MNNARQARVNQPLQLRRMLGHVDASDAAFAQANAAASVRMPVSIAGNQPCDELMEVGIVTHHQHALAIGILRDQLLEGGKLPIGSQHRRIQDGLIEAHFRCYKLGCLPRSLERAGDDDIHLHLEPGEDTGHQHALLLAFLDQAALDVEKWIFARNASICVAHEIEIH